ncbi:dioxygenase [Marinitoga sp. 1154]|uniref:AmmeMemoRadiSam system protein B n=1 Tax=Marinitoga sp. 1154 TaxID=1643335 RepID=UPI001586AC44|nr:AmmeMemoRadiSam system protein B [Marinitoga sp. 1154]NUU99608.1 dioxygenase [Marinitoga sp. 1154]
MKRYPVVAGTFYPENKKELLEMISEYFPNTDKPDNNNLDDNKEKNYIKPTGLISPHAGYIFSGKTASYGYYEIFKKGKIKSVIIIGPNHTGIGPNISVYPEGTWITPLGELKIDKMAKTIVEKLEISGDYSAHQYEHSIEVQLPFLQYLYGNTFKIVPIILGDQSLYTSKKLAEILNELMKDGILIIASSDLNHYENHEITMKKGEMLINAIQRKNPELLYEKVKQYSITACGYGCINTLLYMNFEKVKILNHTTSATAFGDYDRTVGYLSALLEK